jgi:hypothetical protein
MKEFFIFNKCDFFSYYDIVTKFPPPLTMVSLYRGICRAHKVDSPLPTKFFPGKGLYFGIM